ncbi:MAG: hypothetical protein FD145_1324 [Candidatus Saganbacteria bacterium]|uniref:Uncharacterized protein n=1 Tax=Candidatus Saganbacteria bacterium TaxID=2575572 RepID=A0A833NZK9_UNCSA|nr:MAG: hypothetical protein FD145_1324 [Candidatus Saganbacteria bacterium]
MSCPKQKIKKWEQDGKKHIEISFDTGYELREGVHYFLVKYKDPQFNNEATSAYVILHVKGKRTKAERLTIDNRIPKIFGKLYKAQQKLKSLSAKFKGHFEVYIPPNPPVMMDFMGKFTAIGWNKFPVVLAAPPTYTIEEKGRKYETHDEKWKEKFPKSIVVDRNHLGAFNLAFYMDYFAIMDHYSWEVAFEDSNKIDIRGWANELKQKPYQYLIEIDKKRWVPTNIQTFLDKETVVSYASVDYQKVGKIDVPIKQVTLSKFRGGYFHEYTLDLSQEIEINKVPPEKGGMI